MKELKIKLTGQIKSHFPEIEEKDYEGNRLDFTVRKETVSSVLVFMKDTLGFKHLSHISCVDWIEENVFELIFIIWSPTDKLRVFIRTRIDRANPVMDNMDMIWPQMHTYERELKEMYGISFEGLEAPDEFLLEDWDGPPPMRRDFDTEAYAHDTFFERPGREDAQDVRETLTKRTGEDLPDFAKKYSR
jgi:NADH-quinone oxidoreductase subunit C